MNYYDFYRGKEFEAYHYLGAHVENKGVVFRTFAPAAEKIAVIGEFNNWQETDMHKVYDGNFWECTIDSAKPGMKYKYRIYEKTGRFIDHADPYAFFSELRPDTCSIIYDLSEFSFQDQEWLKSRKEIANGPINIYEMHFGSWKKKAEDIEAWYSYEELSEWFIPYLLKSGYNFVEIMPLNEYPADPSWGYQATGFFSPTSRYGNPDGLRSFIEKCHKNNIGVILDFVPVHFAVNDYGLKNYDGTALYEYPHSSVGYNEWGSCNFIHSRGEVCSFLQSAAYYWLNEYHFDGLRMDAVRNLIYWQGDMERGKNQDAIKFLQNMNLGLKKRKEDVLLIAEDSSAFNGVTKPVSENGLGFDYKWDMGWMNDTLSFLQSPPEERSEKYHKLTFSMHYFYNERFLLPLSHDEVVHGKATIVQKMNGKYDGKFLQARALYLYMYAHPGIKLNFMGNELGQMREWDEKRELDWDILSFPIHDAFYRFICDLNKIYLSHSALYENDYERAGFSWIDCSKEKECIYIFERRSSNQKILVILNFSDKDQIYEYQTPIKMSYTLLIATDMERYGGTKIYTDSEVFFESKKPEFKISPFSGRYYLVD